MRTPDLVIHSGRIYRGGPSVAPVEALAITGGRIAATGRTAEVLGLAGHGTRVVDLGGRTVLPGLIDSHNHLLEAGTKLSLLRLDECRTVDEMAALVRRRAETAAPGTWIIGQGWNEANFPAGRLPARADIDGATDRHPVLLMRFFNTDLVNSVALRMAGITAATADPPDGVIGRDEAGEPSGLLVAAARTLVRRLVPQPSPAELSAALRLAYAEALSLGITSVVEPGLHPYEMRAYHESYRAGELAMRVALMPNWYGFRDTDLPETLDARAAGLGVASGFGDEWLRLGGLKMAIDGGTTTRDAYMYEPFAGDHELKPLLRLDLGELRRYLEQAHRLGWDVGIHCCGDRGQDVAVETLAEVMRAFPRPAARHSIIHAYFPSDRALSLMAAHQIAAVIQPTFLYWEGNQIFADVGEERAANYKPSRRYLDAGVPLIASSDVTSTVTAAPFVAMYALVTRYNCAGRRVAPNQAITRQEALAAYTTAGAWLTHEEAVKGRLVEGHLADLIVIDRDYFQVPDDEIRAIQVEATVVGGKVASGELPTC